MSRVPVLPGRRSLRRSLASGGPRCKSACCAGWLPPEDGQIGSSQAAINNSGGLSLMPQALSATACIFSKLTTWWKLVVRPGATWYM